MGDAPETNFAESHSISQATLIVTPTHHEDMQNDNSREDTSRDTGHSWIWSINPCTPKGPGCVTVYATPQPNGQATPWKADAHLSNGRYTMAVDVPDGVRCVVQFFPSHDVYSWDAVTLAGQVDSTFDTGCGGGPGGTDTYPFSLVRW
jgi:hypothetical protein